MTDVIDKFDDEYAFLSNFYYYEFEYDNMTWLTAEHAFQAQKSESISIKKTIKNAATPGKAKRIGNTIKIINNWDNLRVEIMLDVLRAKFTVPELRQKLLNTESKSLVESNSWGDNFWGVDNKSGIGKNMLGQLLMKIRAEIADQLIYGNNK